jgi:hypothetical protein
MLLLVISLLLISSADAQSPKWKGKIEYEDGIKVVTNPGQPFYGAIEWKLQEELCIGNEEDDKYMFYFPVNLAVDSKGNIFVLVAREFEIRKFNSDGKFLAAAGKRGQGPGEFEQPWGLYLDSLGRVYTFDSRRNNLHIFSNELGFIETRKLEFRPHRFSFAQDNRMILVNIQYSPQSSSTDIILTNPSGELVDRIASFPYELPPMIKNMMLGNPYSHEQYFAPVRAGGAVYGYSSEYVLYAVSSLGKLRLKISVNRKPEPISEAEKESLRNDFLEGQDKRPAKEKLTKAEVKKAYVFPAHKPFFTNILIDDKSQIFAKKLKIYDPDDTSITFDFFNEEGIYLYDVTMPFYPRALAGQCLYRFDSNRETGYVVIKRYRITNLDQLKTGIN